MKEETLNKEFQRFFENGVIGCLKQGKQSLSKDDLCRYRGEDDCKCFVGFNIKDEAYDKSIEGLTPCSNLVSNALINSGFTYDFLNEYDDEISNLQQIHDYKNPELWYNEFKNFAKNYKLDSSFMDTLQVNYSKFAGYN